MNAPNSTDKWLIPPIYWTWVTNRWVVTAMLWAVCLATAASRLNHARDMFSTPEGPDEAALNWARPSGTHGHTEIDFGGQWLLGRMVVDGHADQLYNRNRQWEVAWAGFPIRDEPPALRDHSFPTADRPPGLSGDDARHDAENLMTWLVGTDPPEREKLGQNVVIPFAADSLVGNPLGAFALTAAASAKLSPEAVAEYDRPVVGGPLYPPIHGFFYAPVALFPPADAYIGFQYALFGLTFAAGWAARVVTRGVLWWPVATWLILAYPGSRAGFDLGQNPVITVAILLTGWAFAVRGRDGLGGLVWGLLAFKPVWAASFFLVPLLMRRWRFCGAMLATGAVLGVATLPFTGVQVWFDWLEVGKLGTEVYLTNENWILLSRDLFDLPRRMLIDFGIEPESDRLGTRDEVLATRLGWTLWGFVLVTTVVTYLRYGDRRKPVGLGTGLLFLGAWLCCYRFMYYDVLVSVVPAIVLLADPSRWLRSTAFDLRTAADQPLTPVGPDGLPPVKSAQREPYGPAWVGFVNSFVLTVVVAVLVGDNFLLPSVPELRLSFEGPQLLKSDFIPGGPEGDVKLSVGVTYYYAWDTVLILTLWAWAVVRVSLFGDHADPPDPPRN